MSKSNERGARVSFEISRLCPIVWSRVCHCVFYGRSKIASCNAVSFLSIHSLTPLRSCECSIRLNNLINYFHSSRSFASCSSLVHSSSFSPDLFTQPRPVLLRVSFDLPRLLLPSELQVNETRQLLSFSLLKMRLIHVHRLNFSFWDGWDSLSSSLIEVTVIVMPSVRPKFAEDSP